MAPYQIFKLSLVDFFGLSKDGFHIILGFLIFLLFVSVLKIKIYSWRALIAPVIFATTLEVLDFRDAIAFNTRIDYFGSVKDMITTTFLPLVLVTYLKIKRS